MEITECEAYKKLLAAVEKDASENKLHDYRGKLDWVIARAKHYSEKTGIDVCEILNAWEKDRNYWYMNYYQDCNQPLLDADTVRVFENTEVLKKAICEPKFRCPRCEGISTNPYECDSGKEIEKGKVCDWKVWGLFGDLGKGAFIFVKSELRGQKIFMPLSWEAN